MCKKQVHLFKRGYKINNENKAENKKQITQTRHKLTQAQTWT